jgi:hypothetical protein
MSFEVKYTLPVSRAPAVAAWLDARCLKDPVHPEGHVRNLYLDTPGLRFLLEKVEGDFLKTKIRLRWYAANETARASGPVILEIKQRASVSRDKIRIPFEEMAATIDRAAPEAIDGRKVVSLVRQHGHEAPEWLRPTLALRYSRLRWIEPATGVRVALDRGIKPTWVVGRSQPAGELSELRTAVVEFKGPEADAPPALRNVVRFGARRTSFSKYHQCYARLFPGMSDEEN